MNNYDVKVSWISTEPKHQDDKKKSFILRKMLINVAYKDGDNQMYRIVRTSRTKSDTYVFDTKEKAESFPGKADSVPFEHKGKWKLIVVSPRKVSYCLSMALGKTIWDLVLSNELEDAKKVKWQKVTSYDREGILNWLKWYIKDNADSALNQLENAMPMRQAA